MAMLHHIGAYVQAPALAAFLAVFAGGAAAEQAADPVTETFSGHDPDSEGWIDHSLWSEILDRVVLEAGRSNKRLSGSVSQTQLGSNLKYGNSNSSRYENNRIAFHLMSEEAVALVRAYRQGLEEVSRRIDLTWLKRNEQLAYWLNLYNATVMEQIAERYPMARLRGLREDLWDEPLLRIGDLELSLRDIETRILFPLWDDPLVLYGLWQGSVGGPRLPAEAYTAENVWRRLEANAREFINSNRGIRPFGDRLLVSDLYEWCAPLFEGDIALIRHISAYARPPFVEPGRLERIERVAYKLYDWHVADLNDGTPSIGRWNQLGGLVSAEVTGSGVNPEGGSIRLGDANFLTNMTTKAQNADLTHLGLSPQGVLLLRGMAENNRKDREPKVTVEECPPGEVCKAAADPESQERPQQ